MPCWCPPDNNNINNKDNTDGNDNNNLVCVNKSNHVHARLWLSYNNDNNNDDGNDDNNDDNGNDDNDNDVMIKMIIIIKTMIPYHHYHLEVLSPQKMISMILILYVMIAILLIDNCDDNCDNNNDK